MGFVNTIGRMFTPQNTMFFDIFEEISVTVVELGDSLKKLISQTDINERAKVFSLIEDLEHKNDNSTHHLLTELGRNFITPFDREDIHALALALDDICDGIFASAKRMHNYNVDLSDTGIVKMTDIIQEGTKEVANTIKCLRNMKNMRAMTESLVRINSIENQGDDIYDLCNEQLFNMEQDIKTLIKKREIYQMLEKTTDELEDAANVVESIIIKYS